MLSTGAARDRFTPGSGWGQCGDILGKELTMASKNFSGKQARPELSDAAYDQIAGFFAPAGYERIEVANPIDYDFDTLKGRAVSSSYAPLPGHARHDEMVAALRAVYDRHQVNGRVRMDYITQIYVGHPNL